MKFKNPRFLFPFFMALFMAFFMSGIMTLVNIGPVSYFFKAWAKSYFIGFCVAMPVAYFIAPLVQKIVSYICKK
jgi:hypothetical protein